MAKHVGYWDWSPEDGDYVVVPAVDGRVVSTGDTVRILDPRLTKQEVVVTRVLSADEEKTRCHAVDVGIRPRMYEIYDRIGLLRSGFRSRYGAEAYADAYAADHPDVAEDLEIVALEW